MKSLKSLGEIIKAIRIKEGLNQTDFGIKHIGFGPDSAQSNVSQYERNLTQPSFDVLVNILCIIGIDLLTEIENKLKGEIDDPEIIKDLSMAKKVLSSGLSFADSLRSNIRDFYKAVEMEEKIKRSTRIDENSTHVNFPHQGDSTKTQTKPENPDTMRNTGQEGEGPSSTKRR